MTSDELDGAPRAGNPERGVSPRPAEVTAVAVEEDQCLAGFLFTGVCACGREEGQDVLLDDATWAVNCLEPMRGLSEGLSGVGRGGGAGGGWGGGGCVWVCVHFVNY